MKWFNIRIYLHREDASETTSSTTSTTTQRPTTTSTTTLRPTTTSTTTTTTPKPTTTSTTSTTTAPPTTTPLPTTTPQPTVTKPHLPRRHPYPRTYRPRTTSTTAVPQYLRPDYPRRPEVPVTPTEVTGTIPRNPVTIERDRQPDGSYSLNTSDIPKETWAVVTGKDKTDDFDPTQLHCLNGYERNERGECAGKIRF